MWGIVPMKTTMVRYKEGTTPRDGIIQIRFPKHRLAKLFKLYGIGQYCFINFPGISFLEWHPFSISSGPDEQTAEIHVKGLGNHTSNLIEKAKAKQMLWIRVDGPYGRQRINYRRFPTLLLIGGGIGFTPVLGIIKDMFRTGDLDPKKENPKHCVEQVYVIWTIQNSVQYGWFAEEIQECWDNSGKPGMPALTLQVYVTRPLEDDPVHPNFYTGKPNFSKIFEEIVTLYPKRATTVFVCGPKQMVNQTWDSSVAQGRKGNKFHFHHELFEF